MNLNQVLSHFGQAQASWSNPKYVEEYEAFLAEDFQKSLANDTATAGFQTPLAAASGTPFSPLVPQDLDALVGALDFRAEHLAFWDWLPKATAKNTVVDWAAVVTNGDPFLDGALAEGELGGNDTSTTKKGSCKIRSYSNRREITDIAQTVALMNSPTPLVSTSQLEMLTRLGMLQLHKNLEIDALFAKNSAQVNKLDGVISQLEAANQYDNLNGATVSLEYFEDKIRDLTSAPYYARPTHIFVAPKVFTNLSKQQNAYLRREPNGKPVLIGFQDNGLKVTVGGTEVVVEQLKFLDQKGALPAPEAAAYKIAKSTDMADPAIALALGAPGSAPLFEAGDVGEYHYGVMVVGADGSYKMSNYSGAVKNITAVAGKSIVLTLTKQTTYAGGYAFIFRTAKSTAGVALAADAQKASFEIIGRVAISANNDTVFTDLNTVRNNTSNVLILRKDPEEIVLYQLIKMFRKPLAPLAMSNPFALFTACGLQVKVPEHQWLLKNVGHG